MILSLNGQAVTEMFVKFPKAANRTLAQKLHADYPKLFSTVEQARDAVRYYRGVHGDRSRENCASKEFHLPRPTVDNPLSLPSTDIVDYPPYKVARSLERGLIMYDMHVPYHHPGAVESALRYARDFKVDHVIIAGDFMDCYQLSTFDKDPSCRNFPGEIHAVRQMFMAISKALRHPKMIVMEGNHEMRMKRLLMRAAPVLLGCEEFRLDHLIGLKDFDADWVDDKRVVHEGNLAVFHGHELGKFGVGGVNPARTLYLRTKATAVCGHCHQHSTHQEKDIHDAIATCWTVGCLCELRPRYQPVNSWSHGFMLVEKDKRGWFQTHHKRIMNGRIV
jgi:predicted phosphodiesterase